MSFAPTKVFYIQLPKEHSREAIIQDISSDTEKTLETWTDATFDKAKGDAGKVLPPTYNVKSTSLFSPSFSITDSEYKSVCSFMPLPLNPSQIKIIFPIKSLHSSHYLEMRPVEHEQNSVSFVKDDTEYIWATNTPQRRILSETQDDMNMLVSEYRARDEQGTDGLLAVDESKIDAVVAMVTCFAFLTRGS